MRRYIVLLRSVTLMACRHSGYCFRRSEHELAASPVIASSLFPRSASRSPLSMLLSMVLSPLSLCLSPSIPPFLPASLPASYYPHAIATNTLLSSRAVEHCM